MSSKRCLVTTFAVLTLLTLTSTGWAQTAVGFTQPPPNTVNVTLTACRNTGQTPLYVDPTADPAIAPLICADDSAYTGGNLQKNWNELDFVPHRLTVVNGKSGGPVSYSVIVAGDYLAGANSQPGYFHVSNAYENASKSDTSCNVNDAS